MFSVSALALVALAGQDQISLMRKLKVGDTAEYSIAAQFDGQGGTTIKFSSHEIQKVTAVQTDGGYTVQTDTKDQNVDLGDQTMTPPDTSEVSSFSATGRITNIASDQDVSGAAYRIVHLQTFETPKDPVKVGDEIKYTVPADTKLDTPAVDADYKVEGLEKIQNWNTVKLTFKSEETAGDLKASMSGTIWVDAGDGGLVKSEGVWTNVQPPGVPFPLTGKYNLTRTK
jgi:hypothetical protein